MLPSADSNRYIVQVYVGALSALYEALSVEASKQTTADEIVSCIVERLLLNENTSYELSEVIRDDCGRECKERRLSSIEHPVQIMMLWPKNRTDQSSYRFYLREKVTEFSWKDDFVLDPQLIKDYFQRFLYQPKDREYPDLCQLPDLNEKTLLDNLQARFNAGHIYTYVGSILIALNPFKFYPIYNPKYVKLYQNRRFNLPPHIFAVADTAYYCMLKDKKNQCIVISGESGSGKTESTNFLLHHLTALSQKDLHDTGVEQTILSAGPVLEAFGNAKTAHNNNSSRFGKFIQVNYKENGMVHGAVVQKYLLEKSRICSQARNERNYHVFYYLLEGASESEKQVLHLLSPQDYYYLNKSCYQLGNVDENYEFSRLKQSMEMVGFTPEKQRRLFSVLSAVLLLGNVEFQPRKPAYHHDESVGVKNTDIVLLISQLLRVKHETLLQALVAKRAKASGETLIINYRLPEAIASRDAMAKCLYGALFDWIVLQVNHALLSKKDSLREHHGNSIGVLDIFGFEDFGLHNCFEQLCINYANEHLQYYFNQHVFKYEQEEYRKEGIRWNNIDFMDNTGCLQLIEGKPSGLLCILDDQCNFPGATNDTLLQKFHTVHKTNRFYHKPQKKESTFVVIHYAGKVKYQVTHMREKNLDLMRQDIVSLLKNSSMAFVRELVGADPVAVFRWAIIRAFFRGYFAFKEAGNKHRQQRADGHKSNLQIRYRSCSPNELIIRKNRSFRPRERSKKGLKNLQTVKTLAGRTRTCGNQGQLCKARKQPLTVTAQFQQSLHLLMDTLNQANPFFIRCIKSNSHKIPNQFDDETVQRQLRYTGMLETVRIRQAGFNVRLSYEEFIQLYRILLPKGLLSSQNDVRDFLFKLNLDRDNYQLGCSKVFLRESEKHKLDCRLHQQIMTSIITLQRWFRACLERKHFLRIRSAVLLIQSYFRMALVQKHFKQNAAATKIQEAWKAYKIRKWFNKFRESLIIFQAHCRGSCVRMNMAKIFKINPQKESAHHDTFLGLEHITANSDELLNLSRHKSQNRQILRSTVSLPGEPDRHTADPSTNANRTTFSFEDITLNVTKEDNIKDKVTADIIASCATYIDENSKPSAIPSNPIKTENKYQTSIHFNNDLRNNYSDFDENRALHLDRYFTPDKLINSSSQKYLRKPCEIFHNPSAGTSTKIDEVAHGVSNISISQHEPLLSNYVSKEQIFLQSTYNTRNADMKRPFSAEAEIPIRSARKIKRWNKKTADSNYTSIDKPIETCDDTCLMHTSSGAHQRYSNLNSQKAVPVRSTNPHSYQQASIITKRNNRYEDDLDLKRRNSDPMAGFHLSLREKLKHIDNKDNSQNIHQESTCTSKDDLQWQNTNTFLMAGHLFRKIHRIHKGNLCTFCNGKMDPFITHIYKCLYCKKMFHTKCIQNKGVLQMPCNEHVNSDENATKLSRRKQQKQPIRLAADMRQKEDSKFSLTGTSEFTDRSDQIITGADELTRMQQFITEKVMKIENETKINPSEVDRVFKLALREFKDNLVQLYSAACKHGFEACSIRYKDLIINFMQVMENVCKRETKEGEDFPLTMGVNAFRGFMNEFMLSRQQEKPNKTKRKKEKNRKVETIKYKNHTFLLTIINIPMACEVCNSFFMWPLERSLVCQSCKLTCHKKCYLNAVGYCEKNSSRTDGHHKVFGVPLATLLTEENKIPLVVERLLRTIELHGLYTEGIYRKSGVSSKIKLLKQKIDDTPDDIDFERYHVHVLASVLKSFLREMPEPLLTFECYENFITAANLSNPNDRVTTLYDILKKIPSCNYDLMERLVFHLARVALHEDMNRMSCESLAIVFAPCILRTNKIVPAQDSLQDISSQTQCVATIIREQLRKITKTLDDINTLDTACQAATNRLSSLRSSKIFSPDELVLSSHSSQEQSADEEHILVDHIQEIQKEKEHLTSTLPTLSHAMFDDDMLSTDGDGSLDDISYIDDGKKLRVSVSRSTSTSDSSKFVRQLSSDVSVTSEDPVMV